MAGSDAMINGGSYQVASTEDILKVQNRIKQEVGKKKVSESNLKTSLVLYGSGSSKLWLQMILLIPRKRGFE